ncbi:oxidoreductase [Pseudovirgaria hyperparasitica]|uniref:Oxidoreductase n=1 Tax=Pseudovirgaria hyperparasitica TaxID=470096 RepID=A0A6A6VRZ2_9PEZI|nr:oxidoreductase [Pseudovirgaria hyperparasitica]KAF2753448.1 oxidoreductase [Pseudovirgaria hyperparasitica]
MFGGKSFEPERDIPDLSGKVILVTGGNTGLGQEAILQLAKHKPAHIYMGARTASKAEQAIKEIKAVVPDAPVSHIPLDLTSFESISACAKQFNEKESRLDILYNNAGIMATPMGLTKEGYEIQFGTNHMGHFLLTRLLLPKMEKTADEPNADVRIVNVSSEGHRFAPNGHLVTDAESLGQMMTWRRYGMSKLANILHARELARRYPKITAVSIHPGVIKTNLYTPMSETNFILKFSTAIFGAVARVALPDVPAGAKNQLWAGTCPKSEVRSGAYYTPIGKEKQKGWVDWSDDLARKLWDYSEAEVQQKGY